MPQSLSAVYLHLVFSTKDRRARVADPGIRARLHEYIGAVSRELDCPPIQVGGVADHIHLLVRQGREISQSELVKEIKRVSSRWLKTLGEALEDFEWQRGYAVFSVSPSNLDRVRAYVAEQEKHHAKFDYQRELRTLLQRHGLESDEKYLWD
ncbi:MAG: IS200/IS605 family transposase [Candidatus Odyssella sp.]|nr:IS200/IS605 family transposase [Candidatus Odyssella sp.]